MSNKPSKQPCNCSSTKNIIVLCQEKSLKVVYAPNIVSSFKNKQENNERVNATWTKAGPIKSRGVWRDPKKIGGGLKRPKNHRMRVDKAEGGSERRSKAGQDLTCWKRFDDVGRGQKSSNEAISKAVGGSTRPKIPRGWPRLVSLEQDKENGSSGWILRLLAGDKT